MEENVKEKKQFFKDKKNIAITVLSILVLLLFCAYPSQNNDTTPTSSEETDLVAELEEEKADLSAQLAKLNEEINSLKSSNQTLTKENEDLVAKLSQIPSVEELQKTIDEKNGHILNLEAQVGTLTAEKAQIEAQNGILQQQLSDAKKSSSASSATSSKSNSSNSGTTNNVDTSATVYITKTGDKYHRSSCSYLRSSKISISKNSAISQGYTACSRCNP